VVSTNVAETSITIDDVTTVVDCGRVREMGFDPGRGIARLQDAWVSQARARARARGGELAGARGRGGELADKHPALRKRRAPRKRPFLTDPRD
jgi:hypothetical protein